MKQPRTMVAALCASMMFAVAVNVAAAQSATTTSSNAADSYLAAVKLVDAIQSDEWGRYEEGVFDKDAAAFFAKHGRVADLVRAGAALPSCDWGGTLLDSHISFNAFRTAAGFTIARARFEQTNGDIAGSLDDLLAVITFARRIGADALMVNKLIEEGMEATTARRLAAMLPHLNREELRSISARLAALPVSSTGQQIMAAELEYIRKEARKPQTAPATMPATDPVEPLYLAMSDSWDKPQAEFASLVNAKMDELKLSDTDRQNGTTTILIHEALVVSRARRAMLVTAIDFVTRGEVAIQESRDPLGKGPFRYVKTEKGFELVSEYKWLDQPVKLVVGE